MLWPAHPPSWSPKKEPLLTVSSWILQLGTDNLCWSAGSLCQKGAAHGHGHRSLFALSGRSALVSCLILVTGRWKGAWREGTARQEDLGEGAAGEWAGSC